MHEVEVTVRYLSMHNQILQAVCRVDERGLKQQIASGYVAFHVAGETVIIPLHRIVEIRYPTLPPVVQEQSEHEGSIA
jgi:uncharacterized protein (UPF0248 family)